MSPSKLKAGAEETEHSFVDSAGAPFTVTLTNFEGPFDLLLQLIAKRQLDVTEVALSKVTDEFIAHVKLGEANWDLDTTSQFLLVAATLLDLKAARLLPGAEVEDVEDLELLAARDLLFARLLQYRAFKQVSVWLAEQMQTAALLRGRPGGLEEQFQGMLPEVQIPGGVTRLAKIAERVFSPVDEPQMPLAQLHLPQVSVAEQANLVADRLRRNKTMTFRELVSDADRLHTVARFLALLELFRQTNVSFEQLVPLGELTIRWTGDAQGDIAVSDEFDGTPHSTDAEPAAAGDSAVEERP